MKITRNGFDYTYFLRELWNDWARHVVDENTVLRSNERARLLGAFLYPDTLMSGVNEYLFYKALRSSEDTVAQRKAAELAFSCRRFARMEAFLAGRERRDDMRNVIPLVQPPRPVVNPLPAASLGALFGMPQAPMAPIFRPVAVMR